MAHLHKQQNKKAEHQGSSSAVFECEELDLNKKLYRVILHRNNKCINS